MCLKGLSMDTLTSAAYGPDCRAEFEIPTHIERRSVYADSEQEILKFKWIESQRAGRDLGEEAVKQWVINHWSGFLRARWIEHLQGIYYWTELDSGDFALLQRESADRLWLLHDIVERLKLGHENLNLLDWACECKITRELILDILERLHINSKRLKHRYDPYLN
jgi:hypothetical protein